MSIDLKNLKKIVTFCKKNHVDSLEIANNGDIKLHILPAGMVQPRSKSTSTDVDIKDTQAYTDEQTLFWSSDMSLGEPQ